jgi:rhodanese-related sulfurtransferase
MTAEYQPIEVTVQQTKTMLQENPEIVLIDCRESDEYAIAHIEGSILMPLSELQQNLPKLEALKQKSIIVHCHHGGRSMRMVLWMRKNGFLECLNMAGGIDAWSTEIDSAVPRY